MNLTIILGLDELDSSFQIHFDGWELDYDYWTTPMSPYIHPLGWCEQNGVKLNPPKGEFYEGKLNLTLLRMRLHQT